MCLPPGASPVAAQDSDSRWLPGQHPFQPLLAAPREPRFGVGMLISDLFASPPRERPPVAVGEPDDARRDVQGVALLGGTVPLVRLGDGRHGEVTLGLQAGVAARFRMEEYNNDALSDDWLVALPVEAERGPWTGRLRLLHRSAHLGDEFIQYSGAERITYSYEAADLLVARRIGGVGRAYAGGEVGLDSRGFRHNAAAQAGIEGHWTRGSDVFLRFGLDGRAERRTDWAAQIAAAAGVELRRGGRSASLLLRYFDGPSPLGQFHLTDETYWGLELVLGH